MAIFVLSLTALLLISILTMRFVTRQVYRQPVRFKASLRPGGGSSEPQTFSMIRARKKPEWVTTEIIHLKAHLPTDGCRTIAHVFNRRFAAQGVSVGKTFIAEAIAKHRYQIHRLRRKLKNQPARPVPRNKYWGMDLTQIVDADDQRHKVLGICEHFSRLNVMLRRVPNKASITLLRCLLDAIETYGKPESIRTDNEPVFTSRLFTLSLWFLGVKHQTTELHCPWQNGRIERLFGTLKTNIRQIVVANGQHLDCVLMEFRFFWVE